MSPSLLQTLGLLGCMALGPVSGWAFSTQAPANEDVCRHAGKDPKEHPPNDRMGVEWPSRRQALQVATTTVTASLWGTSSTRAETTEETALLTVPPQLPVLVLGANG
eukprot:CAMPEP_0172465466 /NCGR_PEP_ID=MMETSP1065-20121228/53597_1 /TAXON_ID=265537 /ORGANISM="Amphiprora paludosa, Strain CCMP125" /LENGTH=106 /DNA_ID=CAMNT_0013221997 /DNA_START=11 /DNA_END=328 /DNA_ORIENTATION=+